jgi:hypothetical protein
MHVCLRTCQLKQLLDFELNQLAIEDQELRSLIDSAEGWQDELGAREAVRRGAGLCASDSLFI